MAKTLEMEQNEFRSDQLAFQRRLGRIHREAMATQLGELLQQLRADFRQAVVDHKILRGEDASTGYGDDPSSVADCLINFFVSAMIGGYKP